MDLSADMLFEFEDEEPAPLFKAAASGNLNVDALTRRFEFATRLPTSLARQLQSDVISELSLLRTETSVDVSVRALATQLAVRGYDVSVMVAVGGGQDCFKSLHHEFLIVRGAGEFSGMEIIVEPSLRQHFAVPHPSPEYAYALASTPDVFVGGSCRLVSIVQLLCALMADSFERQGLPVPPWRREAAIISKWLPSPARTCELKPVPSSRSGSTSSGTVPVPGVSAQCTAAPFDSAPDTGTVAEPTALPSPLPGGPRASDSLQPWSAAAVTRSCISPCCAPVGGCLQGPLSAPNTTGSNSFEGPSEDDGDMVSPFVFVPASTNASAAFRRCCAAPVVAVTGFNLPTQNDNNTCGGSTSNAAAACAARTGAAGEGLQPYNLARGSDFDCGSPSQERSLNTSSILASGASSLCAADSLLLMEELRERARMAGGCCSGDSGGPGASLPTGCGYKAVGAFPFVFPAVATDACGVTETELEEEDDIFACLIGNDGDDDEHEADDEGDGVGPFKRASFGGRNEMSSRPSYRATQTGMLPSRCPTTGLLSAKLVFGKLAAAGAVALQATCGTKVSAVGSGNSHTALALSTVPARDPQAVPPERRTLGSASGRVDVIAPVHPQTPVIHCVRMGWPNMHPAAQWQQSQGAPVVTSTACPQPQTQQQCQLEATRGARSWLPWTLPQQACRKWP